MLTNVVLVLAAAAASLHGFRRRARAAASLPRELLLAAAAFAVARLLAWGASHAAPGGAATAAMALAALACLPLLEALVVLALHDARGRGRIVNAIAAAVALGSLVAPGGARAAVLFATLALVRWRAGARGARPTARWAFDGAAWAIPGALALVALQLGLKLGPTTGVAHACARFVGWATAVATVQCVLALPAMVRDAALGIRRVSGRLALLFALSAFVPLLLTATLWLLTTWLGVASDHALTGARAMRDETQRLGVELRRARAVDPLLSSFGPWLAAREPGTSVWFRPASAAGDSTRPWSLALGRSTPADGALASWNPADSTDVVVIRDSVYLAAFDRGTPRSPDALVLIPAAGFVRRRIEPLVGTRLALEAQFDVADTTFSRRPARRTPGLVISSQIDSARTVRWKARPIAGPFRGRATVRANVWIGHGWSRLVALLVADLPLRQVLTGLFRDVSENPFAVLPLVVITMVALLFVSVLQYDFGMVRDLGRSITDAVASLRAGTTALERGDLAHRIEVRGRDDLWDVASAFNRMAEGLERARALERERERLEGELALARRIQARLLPTAPPAFPGVEIAGTSESARQVGGDYYDHFALGDGRIGLVIADVSGKGVPAALLMSGVRAALLSQPVDRETPAEVFGRINQYLHRSVDPGRFVTAFLAFLDPRSGRLDYCNAGHNPPIVVGPDRTIARLETGGLVLGMLEHAPYQTGTLTLAPGAMVALFTDGVTEAQNPSGALWDEPPLIALLCASDGAPLATTVANVVAAVRAFEAGAPPSDDVTLLLARRSAPIA